MVRRMLWIVPCMLSIRMIAGVGHAAQVCFRLEPFVDIYRVDARQVFPEPSFGYDLTVHVIAPNEEEDFFFYEMQGTGAAIARFDGPIGFTTRVSHGLVGVFEPIPFFNGNNDCTVYAKLDATTISGPWTMQCVGRDEPFFIPPPTWTPEQIETLQFGFDPTCAGLTASPDVAVLHLRRGPAGLAR
jgi:hypothetical protein